MKRYVVRYEETIEALTPAIAAEKAWIQMRERLGTAWRPELRVIGEADEHTTDFEVGPTFAPATVKA